MALFPLKFWGNSTKFLVLDSIRSWNYHFYAMDGIDSELNEKEGRAARKSKFL